jgi:uncharacterized coiled-coil protein SlyX
MTGPELLQHAGALVAMLDAPEGADVDAMSEALAEWLGQSDDKLTAYWAVVKRLDAEAQTMRDLEQTLARRRRYLDGQAERVKTLASELLAAREALGEDPKVKAPMFTAWLATSKSIEVSVEAHELPAAYQRVRIEASKTALEKALEAGEVIDGVRIVERRGVRWR